MNAPLLAILAVFCNVMAQITMKYAAPMCQAGSPILKCLFSPWLIAALGFYAVSFFVTIRVLAVNPLSIAAPVMAGGTFLGIGLASILIFHEVFDVYRIVGFVAILLGIISLTR